MYVHIDQYKHTCSPVYAGVCEYMHVRVYAGTQVHTCAHVCMYQQISTASLWLWVLTSEALKGRSFSAIV